MEGIFDPLLTKSLRHNSHSMLELEAKALK